MFKRLITLSLNSFEPVNAISEASEGSDGNPASIASPDAFIESLVSKVVVRFTTGDIGIDEAASRLVGTGRFEENDEALEFLRQSVCKDLEGKLQVIEDDIAQKQQESDRIRAILGIPTQHGLLSAGGTASAAAMSERAKKKGNVTGSPDKLDKKRKGASGTGGQDSVGDANQQPSTDTLEPEAKSALEGGSSWGDQA